MDGEEQLSGSPSTQPSTPVPPLSAEAVASAARQASTHPPSSAHQTTPLPKLDPHAFVSVVASGHQAVEALLARCRLSEYAPQFAAMGYDDLSFLYSISASPAHMDTLARNVGLKPGHRAKLRDTLSQEASVLTHSLSLAL